MYTTILNRLLTALLFVISGVTIKAQPPIADFAWSFPQTTSKVYFSDQSSGGPTSWLWDFGDGTGSAAKNPIKQYLNQNVTYNVCLTAINGFGSDQTCRNVAIWASGSNSTQNIKGIVYFDKNNNCVYDTLTDPLLHNAQVRLRDTIGIVGVSYVDVLGKYGFNTAYGTFTTTIDSNSVPFYVACPTSGFQTAVISSGFSVPDSLDLGVRCKPGTDLKANYIYASQFKPGNITHVSIHAGDVNNIYGFGCADGISGNITVTYSGPIQYLHSLPTSITPTSVVGNTLTWSIPDFGAIDFATDFTFVMQTDTTALLGQQACFVLNVTPSVADVNPANNSLNVCFVIVSSFDPNDKTAIPSGDIDTAQKELTYIIRFQNTGTATADHVYITDTLSHYIDLSSFKLISYSHPPVIQLLGNALLFDFQNINLPDSFSNEPGSHGYVQYTVRLKENLPIGTTINNTAYIYFDFNPPVVTNTTTNTISVITGDAQATLSPFSFVIYPNPNAGMFTVETPTLALRQLLSVTDLTGRLLLQQEILSAKSEIQLLYSPGIYIVRAGNSVQKLVIK